MKLIELFEKKIIPATPPDSKLIDMWKNPSKSEFDQIMKTWREVRGSIFYKNIYVWPAMQGGHADGQLSCGENDSSNVDFFISSLETPSAPTWSPHRQSWKQINGYYVSCSGLGVYTKYREGSERVDIALEKYSGFKRLFHPLNENELLEKRLKTFPSELHNITDLYHNPAASEFEFLIQKHQEIRGTQKAMSGFYIWPAMQGNHVDLADAANINFEEKTQFDCYISNQDMPESPTWQPKIRNSDASAEYANGGIYRPNWDRIGPYFVSVNKMPVSKALASSEHFSRIFRRPNL